MNKKIHGFDISHCYGIYELPSISQCRDKYDFEFSSYAIDVSQYIDSEDEN